MKYVLYIDYRFPSPCGVWVVSRATCVVLRTGGFRPLAGCGLFLGICAGGAGIMPVSVPLRGVGCFKMDNQYYIVRGFPSPCGVWVVSIRGARKTGEIIRVSVPLRGVGCFYSRSAKDWRDYTGFRPLAGCGLFRDIILCLNRFHGFRPLAGCGLFHDDFDVKCSKCVSVPLRGVGCFRLRYFIHAYLMCFRPLAGCGLFRPADGLLLL